MARTKDPGAPREHSRAFCENAESRVWRASLNDFIVEHNGCCYRVQVKCTQFQRGHSFKCHLDSNGVAYSSDQIDFIAAYVIPADAWYILPIEAVEGHPDILLTPQNPRSKYAKYKEAWHLLKD